MVEVTEELAERISEVARLLEDDDEGDPALLRLWGLGVELVPGAAGLAAGQAVISVDTKKKEKVGNFANNGAEWELEGRPVQGERPRLPGEELGKAVPYGIYDVAANAGWVNVGTDGDTAAFAVESVRRWWQAVGSPGYPDAARLLITADAGGSNGYRTRAWKAGLAALAAESGLDITVCHFPAGTPSGTRSSTGCSPRSR
jgi:hypothetical protein